jgi:type VI secretion system secreted protein VgrG
MRDDRWQMDYRLEVTTPLGPDALILQEFNGSESLSQPFSFRLDLVSEQQSIDPAALLGKAVTWSVLGPEGDKRHFSGIVREFVAAEAWGRGYRVYQAEVVPWFWLLSRTSDCRIFQNKSVRDILQTVLGDYQEADFDLSGIKGSHPSREYCVQYRETDFNFLSRLMEEEGIFYFFHHGEGSHKMVIATTRRRMSDDREVEYETRTSPAGCRIGRRGTNFARACGPNETTISRLRRRICRRQKDRAQRPADTCYRLFDYPGRAPIRTRRHLTRLHGGGGSPRG